MGKNKHLKEKKFDRNVEISAPILDPEIIKAIHSPPRGQRLDLKHGGFKALLSDLNSQDSTDEMSPLNENHVPSYIGISCAVSGYSNYSSYIKRPSASPTPGSELGGIGNSNNNNNIKQLSTPNRSRTTSPTAHRNHQSEQHHVHHIKLDKNTIQSPDEERKELTEKLTASAAEHRRSPSPIPPTEDDRHHGTYVGARYCPLPPPSRIVNKHIPLLGIDDDKDPDEYEDDSQVNKVEQKIANLYGDEFVEDWRESMTHKAKRELPDGQNGAEQHIVTKNPKDLVTLKPTPPPSKKVEEDNTQQMAELVTPSAKVLAGVEKQFLNKLLTDDNPPVPSPPPYIQSPVRDTKRTVLDSPSPIASPSQAELKSQDQHATELFSPSPPPEPTQTKEEGSDLSTQVPISGEKHIEYEIRAESPVDNEASPIRIRSLPESKDEQQPQQQPENDDGNLVSFTPEPSSATEKYHEPEEGTKETEDRTQQQHLSTEKEINDGRYYMNLLDQEKSFILSQVAEAEAILSAQESELDEETTGRIRSAIGKANLLVNKKCNQFRELCESNMNANSNEQYATLNEDLAGFWDMIRIQIDDVKKSFENIWIAKENNWNCANTAAITETNSGDDGSRESSLKDKVSKPKLSAQKDQERRERLKEHINQMKQNQAVKSEDNSASVIRDQEAGDLEQVGCDVIGTIASTTGSAEAGLKSAIDQGVTDQVEEAEEQLFSLMGVTTSHPPQSVTGEQIEEPKPEKPNENLLDLSD